MQGDGVIIINNPPHHYSPHADIATSRGAKGSAVPKVLGGCRHRLAAAPWLTDSLQCTVRGGAERGGAGRRSYRELEAVAVSRSVAWARCEARPARGRGHNLLLPCRPGN